MRTDFLITSINILLVVHQRGQVQRRVIATVHRGRIGPVVHEQRDHQRPAVQNAEVHGRLAIGVPGVRVRAAVQQQVDDSLVAGLRGHVYRMIGRAAGWTVRQVPVACDGPLHRGVVTALNRLPQVRRRRRTPLPVVVVHDAVRPVKRALTTPPKHVLRKGTEGL